MAVVEEEVVIGRPPEEVYGYLERAENLPVWDSSILEAEQLGTGPVEAGTRWRGASKILGRRFDWTTEVIEVAAPRMFRSRSIEGPMSFEVTTTLTADGDGTRVNYRVEAASGLGGVFGRLADPLVEKAHRRTVRANLDTLAELLTQRSE